MNHKDKIVQYIIESKATNLSKIVAICGAADIGKSYLSKEITRALNIQGVSARHLTLDSFLMSRSERLRNGISGYDLESYDFCSIKRLLKDFSRGNSISFSPYNHARGERSQKLEKISHCEVLVLDGLHSMHPDLKIFCNLSIFVYTEDEQLRIIRRQADMVKRKQTPELSQKLEPGEFKKYKKLIEPYKDHADLLIFLQRKWEYAVNINKKNNITNP